MKRRLILIAPLLILIVVYSSLRFVPALNPEEKIKVEVVKTRIKSQREVVESLACPVCGNPMLWDSKWEAFTCTKHGKKAIYEIVPAR